ncbi:SRPBCC family protein [Hyphobacterium sp.]|jgi:uncharacterized protein YndB with AHSA1/START domain|uniref:SRPBCC family protein n=1 Tax=Hyphobacterium sp. TaxID=2004662 RepID=UPI003BABC04F
MTAIIEKTVFLRASPEKVWDFLTQPDALERWFHRSNVPLEAGKAYELLGEDGEAVCWGRVVTADPPTTLVYTFTHNHLKGHESRVQWTLEAVDGGTRLSLRHDGFDGAQVSEFEMLCGHDAGWDEHFGRLREAASAGA